MKTKIKLLLLIFGLALFTSCGEMLSAMSSYNESNGAQCKRSYAESYLYTGGKYEKGVCKSSDTDWIVRMQKYYANQYEFKTYYITSPNSGAEYKVIVYCAEYY